MKRRHFAFGLGLVWGSVATLKSAEARGFIDAKLDPLILDLVGEWQITYLNDAVRIYKVDRQGVVSFEAEDRKGPIALKAEALLLVFPGDPKAERLTMGVDGRLFVEHFPSQEELLKNKPSLIGIGIRQR